ncbi:stage II sporulation protein M [Bacillus piscicola]|uniref:stage II sporulation protein M n=1 Tax=Bacillus piscicola TaxID=1632684 RepID=UPI001F093D7F|nr:stage II sporulation protein M [Bacillus piscicola]
MRRSVILHTVNKAIWKRSITIFIVALSITILATIITYIINPDLQEVMDTVGNNRAEPLKDATGIKKVWLYVVNNGFLVPLQMFILAFIPIQFLYLINVIATVSLPGVLFGVVLQSDSNQGVELIISAIPHFVVEIFAFCLLAAALFELNRVVRSKIRHIFKRDKGGISLIQKMLETVKIYVVVIVPLIVVAAFLETYIADLIFNLLQ